MQRIPIAPAGDELAASRLWPNSSSSFAPGQNDNVTAPVASATKPWLAPADFTLFLSATHPLKRAALHLWNPVRLADVAAHRFDADARHAFSLGHGTDLKVLFDVRFETVCQA